MPLRLLHTSDWHLGHVLHSRDREAEHASFLQWFVEEAVRFAAHVVVVAGDVFDTANPSARAQAAYYGFLRALRAALPQVRIVVVGGNHDSGHRLDAPRTLLDELGVHVVGTVPRRDDGEVDLERLLVPLPGEGGAVAGWMVAMPYVRLQDLPVAALESPAAATEAISALYEAALAAARERIAPGQALVATGHAWFAHAQPSTGSERKVQMGNEAALPAAPFVDAVQYLALGHLHLAQRVGGHAHLRYCGSPIPLALNERTYPHQVLAVTLDGAAPARVEERRVPRTVPFLRVPESGAAPLADVLWALRQLPERAPGVALSELPFLEVVVAGASRVPDLRTQVEAALEGRAAHLIRVTDEEVRGLATAPTPGLALTDADPEVIFREFWQQKHQDPPPEAVLLRFRELLEAVQRGEAS